MEDLFNKMTAYTPDKKINMKELRNLRGTGLDLPKQRNWIRFTQTQKKHMA
jgi:hypothetical protein